MNTLVIKIFRALTRKIFVLACAASLVFQGTVSAQVSDVIDVVAASRDKLAGCEGPYRFDAPGLTPAPKGYVPFYISHYGRHGSRYAWNSGTYTVIKKVLDAATDANALTERGRRLYEDFNAFYLEPLVNTGDLSDLGMTQHMEIARIMCESFPEVFKDGGRILARASTSQRAIVSMNAFTVSLQKNAPKVQIEVNSLHTNLPVTNPTGAPKEIAEYYEGEVLVPESTRTFRDRMTDYDAILGKLFTDRGFLEEIGGRRDFVYELFNLWAGYHNYCDGEWLEDIFTKDQLLKAWEVENYSVYAGHSRNRYRMIPLLKDIIALADEAILTGEYKGHFRFGHDTIVNAFCPLLNIDGSGYEPDKPEDVKYWFQNYDTPKAANIQFVLYRSKRSPEILFKLLRNGREVSLPQIKPVAGPYYRWDDLKSWAASLMEAHPLIQR
ncbi:MAG: hypothetical protein IJ840_03405 [Bacteroidales bacterium]|nr:hypothetical protein [Bacteroidales bacterium]